MAGVARLELSPRAEDVAVEIPRMTAWLDEALAAAGASRAVAEATRLCLHEAVANVVEHGFSRGGPPGEGPMLRVALQLGPRGAVVAVRDNGAPFDPTAHPPRTELARLDDDALGGFGIHLMREQSRRLAYARDGGWNSLTIFIGDAA